MCSCGMEDAGQVVESALVLHLNGFLSHTLCLLINEASMNRPQGICLYFLALPPTLPCLPSSPSLLSSGSSTPSVCLSATHPILPPGLGCWLFRGVLSQIYPSMSGATITQTLDTSP